MCTGLEGQWGGDAGPAAEAAWPAAEAAWPAAGAWAPRGALRRSVFRPLFFDLKNHKKGGAPRGTSGSRGGFLNTIPRYFAKTCTAPARQTTWAEFATHVSQILLLFLLSSARALGGLRGIKTDMFFIVFSEK